MKKIILVVIALLSIGVVQAQFTVAQPKEAQSGVVYSMKGTDVELRYVKTDKDVYYYLTLDTTSVMYESILIHLGNRDKARASLSQLLNELYELGKSHLLNDSRNNTFKVICTDTMGEQGYSIFKEGKIGHGYIRLKQLEVMLEKL